MHEMTSILYDHWSLFWCFSVWEWEDSTQRPQEDEEELWVWPRRSKLCKWGRKSKKKVYQKSVFCHHCWLCNLMLPVCWGRDVYHLFRRVYGKIEWALHPPHFAECVLKYWEWFVDQIIWIFWQPYEKTVYSMVLGGKMTFHQLLDYWVVSFGS